MSLERPLKRIHHILIHQGYRFLAVLSKYGESVYIHHTISNFTEIMNTELNKNTHWGYSNHNYLLYPTWNGSYYELPVDDKSELLWFNRVNDHYSGHENY